ncbi:MAG: valine--tRNA ligase [Acidobacteriota bacterium]
MEIPKAYDSSQAEEHHYARWEASGFFAPEINQDPNAEAFSIVIPPPNVTGTLHMGHALQHTLMDVLTRWKRMLGYKTLFLVGVDHAGISTQLMVTRQLKKDEHKTPRDIGREVFTVKVWEWKNKYGGEITRQIRREGLSVDWTRERFTMEENLSRSVREVFVRLYEEGWIYRGTRIVNWCPKDKTVLSDLEVKEEKAKDGKLYYLRYPVKDGEKGREGDGETRSGEERNPQSAIRDPQSTITVATTRPETMLGDTAVAVHPEDERYKDLIGKTIALPLTGREIPIIADEYVESAFGTGAVKITPAHDTNDWEIGERHGLEKLIVMNDDATMNAAAGAAFAGLDRFAAREKVVEAFDKLGLLEKVEDYDVTLPHCERCKTIIEPLLSEQWFVKMNEMRDLALKLMREENSPRFFPEIPHKKVYTTWLENLRDWTISRQLWWGHQIPAWYDADRNIYVARTKEEAFEQAGTDKLTQDEDVLDTWFSSALWPFSTLGWTGEEVPSPKSQVPGSGDHNGVSKTGTRDSGTRDLDIFYPTDVLVTGRDIIFLWVSRMVMTGLKFMGERPFDDVIIHGTVLDKNGQRMSKTKNNGIDPLVVFEKYGVDATRMALAGSATGVDFAWRDERVESFRNFANKIWNATRFCLMNSEGASVQNSPPYEGGVAAASADGVVLPATASLADRWIVSRLNKTAKAVNRALETYQFHEAVQLLYHFFWDDFCDWYIELVKDEITSFDAGNEGLGDAEKNSPPVLGGVAAASADGVVRSAIRNPQSEARSRILTILEQALRLLHPFMPFLTEELWQKLPGVSNALHNSAYASSEQTIMLTTFPTGDDSLIDEQAESEMASVIELITKVRNIRAEMNIKSGDRLAIHIAGEMGMRIVFASNEAQIKKLARADNIVLTDSLDVPKASARAVLTGNAEIAVPLEGLIDFEKERARLQGQIEKLDVELQRLNAQLSNANFVEKAPKGKVDELRDRKGEIENQAATLRQNLEALN